MTNWCAPGKGATISELVKRFGRTSRKTRADYVSGRDFLRTNLSMGDGEPTPYDFARFDSEALEITYYATSH